MRCVHWVLGVSLLFASFPWVGGTEQFANLSSAESEAAAVPLDTFDESKVWEFLEEEAQQSKSENEIIEEYIEHAPHAPERRANRGEHRRRTNERRRRTEEDRRRVQPSNDYCDEGEDCSDDGVDDPVLILAYIAIAAFGVFIVCPYLLYQCIRVVDGYSQQKRTREKYDKDIETDMANMRKNRENFAAKEKVAKIDWQEQRHEIESCNEVAGQFNQAGNPIAPQKLYVFPDRATKTSVAVQTCDGRWSPALWDVTGADGAYTFWASPKKVLAITDYEDPKVVLEDVNNLKPIADVRQQWAVDWVDENERKCYIRPSGDKGSSLRLSISTTWETIEGTARSSSKAVVTCNSDCTGGALPGSGCMFTLPNMLPDEVSKVEKLFTSSFKAALFRRWSLTMGSQRETGLGRQKQLGTFNFDLSEAEPNGDQWKIKGSGTHIEGTWAGINGYPQRTTWSLGEFDVEGVYFYKYKLQDKAATKQEKAQQWSGSLPSTQEAERRRQEMAKVDATIKWTLEMYLHFTGKDWTLELHAPADYSNEGSFGYNQMLCGQAQFSIKCQVAATKIGCEGPRKPVKLHCCKENMWLQNCFPKKFMYDYPMPLCYKLNDQAGLQAHCEPLETE